MKITRTLLLSFINESVLRERVVYVLGPGHQSSTDVLHSDLLSFKARHVLQELNCLLGVIAKFAHHKHYKTITVNTQIKLTDSLYSSSFTPIIQIIFFYQIYIYSTSLVVIDYNFQQVCIYCQILQFKITKII